MHTLTGGGSTTTYTYNVPSRTVTRNDVTAAGTFTSTYQDDANDNLRKSPIRRAGSSTTRMTARTGCSR